MTMQVPGGGSTTGAVHTATKMAEGRWFDLRERVLFAGLVMLVPNILGVLIGWFAENPPAAAATRSLALTSQFMGNPWFIRVLGGYAYSATTSGVVAGAISFVSLIASIVIVALILLYRVESPQVLLVPSLALGGAAGATLTLRLVQSGPVSLAGCLLLSVACVLGLRSVLSIVVWMNEMRIDSAVQGKWGLRRFHSVRRRGSGYGGSSNKVDDLQVMVFWGALALAVVVGPFVGERLWGAPSLSIKQAVGPGVAGDLHLGGVFASGFVPIYWFGGAMVVVAWGLIALLAPPWTERVWEVVPAMAGLAICSFFLFNGMFDRQAEAASQRILAQNDIEGPTQGQLDDACAWFAKGEKPEVTLAISGPACNESTLYSGRKVVGTNALPASVHPTLAATYLGGPVLLSLEEASDQDSFNGLIALNWLGGVAWTYECPGGAALNPSEFVGAGAGRSSVFYRSGRSNFDRDSAHYIVLGCGEYDDVTQHYINAKDGHEL